MLCLRHRLRRCSPIAQSGIPGRKRLPLIAVRTPPISILSKKLIPTTLVTIPAAHSAVPTIPGVLPSFASGWIDDGMRSGIPREDWGVVVTLYGDAARPVAELTGTEQGRITRVVVLDATGTIAWFDDEGYSARKALEIAALVTDLASAE